MKFVTALLSLASLSLDQSESTARRREVFMKLAAELDLTYEDEGEQIPDPGLDGLPLFSYGGEKAWNDLFRGKLAGMSALIFDFGCDSDGEEDALYQTVAAFRLPEELPAFTLRPKDALAIEDETFIEADFPARNYRLKSPMPKAARAALGYDIICFSEGSPPWSIECNGLWLLVYGFDQLVETEDRREFIEKASAAAKPFRHRPASWKSVGGERLAALAAKECAACGAEDDGDAVFCDQCGEKLN